MYGNGKCSQNFMQKTPDREGHLVKLGAYGKITLKLRECAL
jgi:hypothetical protein